MNAFPATRSDLAFGLLYRLVAFLALCIHVFGLGKILTMTLQTRARIVAFAARLLAPTRDFARLATRALWATLPRHAPSRHARAQRVGRDAIVPPSFGWMAGSVLAALRDAVLAVMASGKLATLVQLSSQAAREVRSPARRLGVVWAAGCYPTSDKPAAEAHVTARRPRLRPRAGEISVRGRLTLQVAFNVNDRSPNLSNPRHCA